MRGPDEKQGEVFSYVPLEDRIPRDHPLRRIRPMVDRGLQEMWSHFEALYARRGRPGVGRDGVHQESGAADGRGRLAALAGGGAAAGGGTRSAERGTLHGGRDADPGLGQPEQFRAQGEAAAEREWVEREEIVTGHA